MNSSRPWYQSNLDHFASCTPPFPRYNYPPPQLCNQRPIGSPHFEYPPNHYYTTGPGLASASHGNAAERNQILHTASGQVQADQWLHSRNISLNRDSQRTTDSFTLLDAKIMLHRLNVLRLELASQRELGNEEHAETEIKELLNMLEDDKLKNVIRSKIDSAQRRKSRRQRCQRKAQDDREQRNKRIEAKHAKLDALRKAIEDEKQNEEMKKAADDAMSGVRQKISDVRKLKELVSSVVKLRNARAHTAQQQGQDAHNDHRLRFEKKISEILETLEKQQETYKKEESALSVMLQHEQDEKKAAKARIEELKQRKLFTRQQKQIELMLFGPRDIDDEVQAFHDYYTQADRDLTSFLAIRSDWDQFVVSDGNGSAIPRGWVQPVAPSSADWAEHTRDNGDNGLASNATSKECS